MHRSGRNALPVVVVVAALNFASPVSAENVGLYLWELSEQPIADLGDAGDGPVTVNLVVGNVQQTATALIRNVTLEVIATDAQSVTVLSRSADSIREQPGSEASASTFMIDYTEPRVAAVLDEFGGETPRTQIPEALREFVYEYISDKTYLRGYDIASQVAATGSGDCTEHAVLLAALARAKGYPARVVLGVLMRAAGEKVESFGHAWTEVHDGQTWRRYDATLPKDEMPGVWFRYLPLMPVVNEGPGFAMGMLEITTLWPRSVFVVPAIANRSDATTEAAKADLLH
jgi:hypothetical protein